MTYYFRSQWGARAPRARYSFGGGDVEGIAIHWPAMSSPLTNAAAVKSALRGWQNYHMDTKRWSDIAYQEAIDQDGNVYELRGLTHQSGANGDSDLNERFGALLLVLAPGEHPSDAMMAATRARIARHRQLHPSSRRIVGHGQIRPGGTECPGPIAQRLIDDGAFNPAHAQRPEEDDMPLTDDDLNRIADRVWNRDGAIPNLGPNRDKNADVLPRVAMAQTREWARMASVSEVDLIAERVAAKVGNGASAKDIAAELIRQLDTE